MSQGLKLLLNGEGIWITGEEWLDKQQTEQMVRLCDELKLKLKKEAAK